MTPDPHTTATIFKAFCEENRVKILLELQSGEKCAGQLLQALNITQPTLSHHMRILCAAGVVVSRKDGRWTYYTISPEGAAVAASYLQALTTLA